MRKKTFFIGVMATMMALTSCVTHYSVSGIDRTRLLIDKTYDQPLTSDVSTFMKPFNAKVDSLMSPVVGKAAMPIEPFRPESPMGNLMPDVLMWVGQEYGEKPDFGVYNIGGMRSALAKGDITIGDVFDVAPFENYVCFVTLTGDKVLELMGQIAYRGGEGVSREVKIVMTPDKKLKRATISGKEIDPAAKYRIAVIDYVSHGNDRMVAFKSATDRHEPKGDDALAREVLIRYIKALTEKGKMLESHIEGRITIEE